MPSEGAAHVQNISKSHSSLLMNHNFTLQNRCRSLYFPTRVFMVIQRSDELPNSPGVSTQFTPIITGIVQGYLVYKRLGFVSLKLSICQENVQVKGAEPLLANHLHMSIKKRFYFPKTHIIIDIMDATTISKMLMQFNRNNNI